MNPHWDLPALFEAERNQHLGAAAIDDGWSRLQQALLVPTATAGVAAAPVKAGLAMLAKAFVGTSAMLVVAHGAGWLEGAPPSAAPALAAAPAAAPVVATPDTPVQPRVDALPTPVEKPVVRALSPAAPAPVSGDGVGSSFDDELRLISNTKRDLDRGQGHLAAAWLSEHASRYPAGSFASEREGLRILIACADPAPASQAAARRFAERFPSSPLLDRIARSCGLRAAAAPSKKSFTK